MRLEEDVSLYLSCRRAEGLAEGTLAGEALALKRFGGWLLARGIGSAGQVRREDVASWAEELARHRYRRKREAEGRALSAKSRHDLLAAVRRFFGWMVRRRRLLADPSASLVLRHPKKGLPKGVPSEEEMARLLQAPGRSALELRDGALLALLYGAGLRRSEAAALDVSDLDLVERTVLVRRGKGGRGRLVPMGTEATERLRLYLTSGRPELSAGGRSPALFVGARRDAAHRGRRLSPKTVSALVKEAAVHAGLEKSVTAHSLRHACATHLLRAGAGVRHVQELLGHAHVATTTIYTRVTVPDLVRVHARTHPRGRRAPVGRRAP